MPTLLRRVRHWIRHRQVEADLAEELESHRAHDAGTSRAGGNAGDRRRHASRRALGNVTLAQEDAREVWTWPSFEQIVARRAPRRTDAVGSTDFRGHGDPDARGGHRRDGAALAVVDAELLAAAAVSGAGTPRRHSTPSARSARRRSPVSAPDFLDWRSQNRAFEELAAFRWTSRHVLRGGDEAESVRVMPVTPNFFAALGRVAGARTVVSIPRTTRSSRAGDAERRRLAPAVRGRSRGRRAHDRARRRASTW